jgi:hypothetical protein
LKTVSCGALEILGTSRIRVSRVEGRKEGH